MVRMNDAKEIYKEVLSEPFDFTLDETIDIDYSEQEFAANKKQLRERWRKQLKYNALAIFGNKVENRISEMIQNGDGEVSTDVIAFNYKVPAEICHCFLLHGYV